MEGRVPCTAFAFLGNAVCGIFLLYGMVVLDAGKEGESREMRNESKNGDRTIWIFTVK